MAEQNRKADAIARAFLARNTFPKLVDTALARAITARIAELRAGN